MSTKKIFIACSQENVESFGKPLAGHLSDSGFEPIRWWNSFSAGDITLTRLVELSNEVNAAVFICLASDKVWYRGNEMDSPRDNVIFEFGIFLHAWVRKKLFY